MMGWMITAGIIRVFLILGPSAPYGRHVRKGCGPTLPAYIGWFIYETPDDNFVEKMASIFRDNNYQIEPVLYFYLHLSIFTTKIFLELRYQIQLFTH